MPIANRLDGFPGISERVPVRRERLTAQSLPWSNAERSALKIIAEDLSVAVASDAIRTLNERLEALAHTDELTQVNNRRSLEHIMVQAFETAERHSHALSILMIDVDHFKSVNDTHGHELGDLALVTVASALRSHLRISDHLGRWGGEEFVVVASHTDAGQAEEFANRLCRAVAAEPLEGVGYLTISIGIAERKSGQSVSALISCADQAMYEAKECGRNRAVRYIDKL